MPKRQDFVFFPAAVEAAVAVAAATATLTAGVTGRDAEGADCVCGKILSWMSGGAGFCDKTTVDADVDADADAAGAATAAVDSSCCVPAKAELEFADFGCV